VPEVSSRVFHLLSRNTMKTFSFLVASTVALVSTSANAGFADARSFIARYQDASGLTNIWAGGSVSASYASGSTVNNVSGTSWQFGNTNGGNTNSGMSLGSPVDTYTEAYVDSWIGGYANGVWSANLGNGAFQFDTSSAYKTASQRSYLTLTASSMALWNNIVATNAVGTFTFELAQSLSSLGLANGNAVTNIGQGGAFDLNGTSFSVNITQVNQGPMPAFLYLAASEASSTIYSANGDTVTYTNSVGTVIGGAVPAPGAIALLGLAGLAGRRRR
jgi:MYXO-CTERM domain-containing protein